MNSNVTVDQYKDKATKVKIASIAPLPTPAFSFKDLFVAQTITLSLPDGSQPAPNLPNTFLLTPIFKNGNLELQISQMAFFQNPPPTTPPWEVLHAMINSGQGVSIALVSGTDVLTLNGKSGDPPEHSAEGNWSSNLVPESGGWSSQLTTGDPTLPAQLFWYFLMDRDGDNHYPEDAIKTLVFGFNLNPANGSYENFTSFPTCWKATFFKMTDCGITMMVTSPKGRIYKMTGAGFSGGLSQLVCNGTWQASGPALAPDGGNWTGTSGGPLP